MLAFRVLRPVRQLDDVKFESQLRYLTVLTILFLLVPDAALGLTAALHPFTYDMYAMHWDHAAGLDITYPLLDFVTSIPTLPYLVSWAYGSAPPLSFMALALLQLRRRPPHVASAVLIWVVLTGCAWLAYHVFPIAGPKYVFGDRFISGLNQIATHPLKMIGVGYAPRNGMPSMHFGWMLAVAILWWRNGTAWWSRSIMIMLTTLTAMSTLCMGEHYVVDLIVAVPFVLAAIALCTTSVPWAVTQRRWTTLIGFGTWAAWVVSLRTSIHWIVAHQWICWMMVLVTMCIVALQVYWMRTFALHVSVNQTENIKASRDERHTSLERRLFAMFFVSGLAALAYQVLFAKQLALVFGSTSTATLTVLATFLGGMAIGSLLGSRLALKTNRPLVTYAVIEMLIAAYCVLTPFLFELIQQVYVVLASGQVPDSTMLLVLRVVLGAVVLLVPTVLMGATLPVLAQALGTQIQRVGVNVAWLYFANTGGAAAGALLTSYVIIPSLGASQTTLVAALLNLLVALAGMELSKRWILATSITPLPTESNVLVMLQKLPPRAAIAALLTLCIGGVLSLGLEVVYVHLLSIVAGNSVYAFGLMLATFLLGLAGGGEVARRLLLKPDTDRIRLLAWTLVGLAISAAGGAWWWNDIPQYFASFAQYPIAKSFVDREAIRGAVCALLMIPPTLFVGAAYAFGMDIATAAGRAKPIAMLGYGAALNTLGNITGVLVFGFFLLPLFGGLIATNVIAFGALALAILVLLITATKLKRNDVVLFTAATFVVVTSLSAQLNYDFISSGSNVYFAPQHWGHVIEHAESIDGGLTTVTTQTTDDGEVKTLLTNGKFQGNDSTAGEMQAQMGFALTSLLHQSSRERALVIGYGTGVTSRVFHQAGFKHLDIAELSRDVVRLADTHFDKVNNRVSSAPGVQLHVTDGRNLLLLSSKQAGYDVVSIEITSIWFAGAASLYNKEFYSLARSRMKPDGVLQQWLQLHRLAPSDLLSVITSLRAEFRYVSLYVLGNQGILIATNSLDKKSPTSEAINQLNNSTTLEAVRDILDRPVADIAGDRMLDNTGIDRFIMSSGVDPSFWVSTDDNLRLEYSTPKANVNDGPSSFQRNMQLLKRFR
ncbi:fused MFS/spermidine synthase [Undibacterium sp. Xuan67W]|uniref:fused MFS/spermidine synthase n=1 Tax=Undibacterium sp. Xuan67W TaxID=3413057 RepID=UPI003BEFDF9C